MRYEKNIFLAEVYLRLALTNINSDYNNITRSFKLLKEINPNLNIDDYILVKFKNKLSSDTCMMLDEKLKLFSNSFLVITKMYLYFNNLNKTEWSRDLYKGKYEKESDNIMEKAYKMFKENNDFLWLGGLNGDGFIIIPNNKQIAQGFLTLSTYVQEDPSGKVKYASELLKQRIVKAAYNLGKIYLNRSYIQDKDMDKAISYLKYAVYNKYKDAELLLNKATNIKKASLDCASHIIKKLQTSDNISDRDSLCKELETFLLYAYNNGSLDAAFKLGKIFSSSILGKKDEITNDNYIKCNNKWKKFFKNFPLIASDHSHVTNDIDNVKIITAYNDILHCEAIYFHNKTTKLYYECNNNEVLKEISVSINKDASYIFYMLSAHIQNNKDSMFNYVFALYEQSKKRETNDLLVEKEIFEFIKQATDLDNSQAAYILGRIIYSEELNQVRNLEDVKFYLNKAKDNNIKEAEKLLKRVELDIQNNLLLNTTSRSKLLKELNTNNIEIKFDITSE
ncbi:11837_t:CDS:2 [Scutellospora calospora]|uniref:11837_t:CDS:1 n=1 Tax=Scutellospora calospora TaxID=85575 RepID=A0ACA9KL16_9GLOM|nr:11837_t:CDS:2 [Scutellospora calospora]